MYYTTWDILRDALDRMIVNHSRNNAVLEHAETVARKNLTEEHEESTGLVICKHMIEALVERSLASRLREVRDLVVELQRAESPAAKLFIFKRYKS